MLKLSNSYVLELKPMFVFDRCNALLYRAIRLSNARSDWCDASMPRSVSGLGMTL